MASAPCASHLGDVAIELATIVAATLPDLATMLQSGLGPRSVRIAPLVSG